ncbi:sialate O-acetylesterase [Abditibacterium utsteinense]|nr:sialate O-acetylesterase [Abditibacterium utsteinense]
MSFFTPMSPVVRAEPATGLSLNPLFSDHMVLQREAPVPVWGMAAAGAVVSVVFGGQTQTAKADAKGQWRLTLAALDASSVPRELGISCGKERLALHDVLVGDVWLCAGQSNMQAWVAGTDVEPLVASADVPSIRVFLVDVTATEQPQTRFRQGQPPIMVPVQREKMDFYGLKWIPSSQQDAPWFSAVTYAFGRALHTRTGVPVGLITAALGGTRAQAWTPREALEQEPSLRNLVARPATELGDNARPCGLYNGSIAPLQPFALKGIVWYQGESDADDFEQAQNYRQLLPALVQGWRRAWMSEIPFLIVQLPAFGPAPSAPVDAPWAWLREAQLATVAGLPQTDLVVSVDTGSMDNLHPPTKKIIGDRLAQMALAPSTIKFNGPHLNCFKIQGGQVALRFAGVGEQLITQEVVRGKDRVLAQTVSGFEVCGADGKFVAAEASIVRENRVLVSSSQVPEPIAVRYGWAGFPECNLFSSDGWPASPFRTDSFAPQKP